MKTVQEQFKQANYHTVVGSGLLAISQGHLLRYSSTVVGSSFSCYEWSYWSSARKVTVTKTEGEAIIIEVLGEFRNTKTVGGLKK